MPKKSIVLEMSQETLNTVSDAVIAQGLGLKYAVNHDGHPIEIKLEALNHYPNTPNLSLIHI